MLSSWSELDWGSVPDWLAGVGTVGTLAVAVRVLSREASDRRKQGEFARSAQARQVRLDPVSSRAVAGRTLESFYSIEMSLTTTATTPFTMSFLGSRSPLLCKFASARRPQLTRMGSPLPR